MIFQLSSLPPTLHTEGFIEFTIFHLSFHPEITKDSSGSVSASGPENFSDEEDGHSSTSGMVSSQQSPITPEPQKGFVGGRGSSFTPLEKDKGVKDASLCSGAKDSSGRPISGRKSPSPRPRSSSKRDPRSPDSDSKQRDYFEGSKRFDNGFRSPQVMRSEPSSCQELLDNNVIVPNKIRDDIPDSELIDYEDDGGESLIESVELEYDDSRVRIFIALFDYDPSVMSPNPDAADEELPFKEGQLIKVGFSGVIHYDFWP